MIQGFKIIDIHCHVYPGKIAEKAAAGTDAFYCTKAAGTGTVPDMLSQEQKAGVDQVLIHSVATTPKQVSSANRFLAEEAKSHPGVIKGFGALHPHSETLEQDVEELISLGLGGVKIHPDIQGIAIDDPGFLKMFDLCRGRIPVLIHTGDKRYDFSNPNRLLKIVKNFPDLTIIGAHLGCYTVWNEESVCALAMCRNFYTDCSSSIHLMEKDTAVRLLRIFGPERVMFGTDYPMWSPEEEVRYFLSLPLTTGEKEAILSGNAKRVLGF